MKQKYIIITAAACNLLLNACVSGDTYEAFDERITALSTRADNLFQSEGYTQPSTLSTNGSASYDGLIALATNSVPLSERMNSGAPCSRAKRSKT